MCIGVGAAVPVARGELVNYTIDPAQSSLTITGNLTGNFASAQSAGSTTTSYGGTIVANRTAMHIEFPGGSAMNANNLASNQQPRNDGTPGSQPANYGRTAPGPFGSTTLEALRGFSLDVFDDTSGLGIPINGLGEFNSQSLQLEFNSGESDASFGTQFNADIDLTGKGTANGASMASTVTTVGSSETLTLRWSTGPISYTVAGSNDSTIACGGTIVATSIIPEPAGLGVMGAMGLIALTRRRRMSTDCTRHP